mmetsp:Transcript_120453/g.340794  ORF Transcript_120453/g.340794 Transcript_120453/m.340794 type:complete len:226 (-) Transcript_120453:100-777(-)
MRLLSIVLHGRLLHGACGTRLLVWGRSGHWHLLVDTWLQSSVRFGGRRDIRLCQWPWCSTQRRGSTDKPRGQKLRGVLGLFLQKCLHRLRELHLDAMLVEVLLRRLHLLCRFLRHILRRGLLLWLGVRDRNGQAQHAKASVSATYLHVAVICARRIHVEKTRTNPLVDFDPPVAPRGLADALLFWKSEHPGCCKSGKPLGVADAQRQETVLGHGTTFVHGHDLNL